MDRQDNGGQALHYYVHHGQQVNEPRRRQNDDDNRPTIELTQTEIRPE